MDDVTEKRINAIAERVLQVETEALSNIKNQLGETFAEVVQRIMQCSGKVVVIGMGKSGHVARKIAATMASLGTCAIFLDPAECMHGDLGMIQTTDLVILISHSGESEEIVNIIPSIKIIGASIIGITSNAESTLAQSSEIVQVFSGIQEACHLGLAPTTSTTVVMAYGDALAVTLSELKNFTKEDFGVFHPAGSLGKRLTVRVTDLMRPCKPETLVREDASLAEAIIAISESDCDILMVIDENNHLTGIVSNGDLKRAIANGQDIRTESIISMVKKYPCFVDAMSMAIDALIAATNRGVHTVPVVQDDTPIGTVTKGDIIKAGIYL